MLKIQRKIMLGHCILDITTCADVRLKKQHRSMHKIEMDWWPEAQHKRTLYVPPRAWQSFCEWTSFADTYMARMGV